MSTRSRSTQWRRDEILKLVRSEDFVSVQDLGGRFGVSIVTVRSDLDELASHGHLRRVRGGAVAAFARAAETPYEARSDTQAAEKAFIARAAIDLLANDDTVLLDVGTTTMALAREIVSRTSLENLSVVTNGLNIALALEPAIPRIQVLVTGGSLRPVQHSLVDPMAGLILQRLRASTVFIGADGIHPDHGVSTTNLPEAEMKKRFLAAASRRVVVADSSKFAQEALVRVCDLDDLDLIVAAGQIDPVVLRAVRERVVVRIAGSGDTPDEAK